MLIGTSIAAGAIALSSQQWIFWDTMSRIVLLGFLFAMLVSVLIILRLIWRWVRGYRFSED
jgi:hypothetical protein